jgi:tetratricopeptide (TPR) repeat protein
LAKQLYLKEKKCRVKIKLIILLLFFSRVASAQSSEADKNIRAGNEFYKQQQLDKAASEYSKAIEADPNKGVAKFNLANTLYRQNKQDEAVKIFTEVADYAEKTDLKAKAYYNKGTVLSQQKKLEESIESYKSTLRLNPDDKEARENLQKALLELKRKNQPKKKEDQKKKKQEQQQKQPQSKMSPKETQQRLQLLAQKEKEVQQRIQKEKVKPGGSQAKDW